MGFKPAESEQPSMEDLEAAQSARIDAKLADIESTGELDDDSAYEEFTPTHRKQARQARSEAPGEGQDEEDSEANEEPETPAQDDSEGEDEGDEEDESQDDGDADEEDDDEDEEEASAPTDRELKKAKKRLKAKYNPRVVDSMTPEAVMHLDEKNSNVESERLELLRELATLREQHAQGAQPGTKQAEGGDQTAKPDLPPEARSALTDLVKAFEDEGFGKDLGKKQADAIEKAIRAVAGTTQQGTEQQGQESQQQPEQWNAYEEALFSNAVGQLKERFLKLEDSANHSALKERMRLLSNDPQFSVSDPSQMQDGVNRLTEAAARSLGWASKRKTADDDTSRKSKSSSRDRKLASQVKRNGTGRPKNSKPMSEDERIARKLKLIESGEATPQALRRLNQPS